MDFKTESFAHELALIGADATYRLIRLADRYGFDRQYTVEAFIRSFTDCAKVCNFATTTYEED